MKKIYNITGMSCINCSNSIQQTLSKKEGVNNINVNFGSNNMIIDFDETIISEKEIFKIVKSLGFKANNLHDNTDLTKSLQKRKKEIILSGILLSILFLIAMGPMIGLSIPFFNKIENSFYFALTQAIIAGTIIILNKSYITKGFMNLIKRTPNMDSLVFIGSMASYLYGIYITIILLIATINHNHEILHNNHMNLYFESSAGILFFVSLGKHLESNAKKNTSNSIKNLLNLIPEKALKLENDNTTREIEINDIKIDDILLVKPGMKIPTDGIIIQGNSSIDEAFLTGESMPKFKKENDLVYTSSINLSSTIYVKSQKENKDSMITQIINLVEEASNSKAPISRIADKISRYFVPTILLLSLITFFIWMFIKKDFSFSIDRAISVLVISCPCALGLATPLSIMKGTKLLVDNHILVKSGEAIEEICKTDTIFLDKTGTITKGFPEVTSIVSLDKNLSENNLLEIAYSLEFLSNHPIAYSINKKAQSLNITNLKVDNFKNYDGIGISGYINDKLYFIGNKKSLEINNIEINDKYYLNDLSTCVFISTTNQLLGVIYIKDELKDNSIKAINNFTNNFKNVVLLSGDNEKSVKSLAKYLNISKYHYECLPQDKQKIIKEYQNNNHTVLMIGDGINDSLSLITSNVGISFKQGSDIAIDSSDFILMANDINEVNTALNISKKIIKNIKFNFFWAFIYNIIFIPIAMGILYKFDILLNPMFASIAMSMSSLCVVINSLLLNYKKEEK